LNSAELDKNLSKLIEAYGSTRVEAMSPKELYYAYKGLAQQS